MNFKIDLNINPNIFRGYDIRGIYGDDLDENVVYTIGLAYAKYIKKNGYNRCVIGRDNRSSSLPLSEALIQGILEGEEIEVIPFPFPNTSSDPDLVLCFIAPADMHQLPARRPARSTAPERTPYHRSFL